MGEMGVEMKGGWSKTSNKESYLIVTPASQLLLPCCKYLILVGPFTLFFLEATDGCLQFRSPKTLLFEFTGCLLQPYTMPKEM